MGTDMEKRYLLKDVDWNCMVAELTMGYPLVLRLRPGDSTEYQLEIAGHEVWRDAEGRAERRGGFVVTVVACIMAENIRCVGLRVDLKEPEAVELSIIAKHWPEGMASGQTLVGYVVAKLQEGFGAWHDFDGLAVDEWFGTRCPSIVRHWSDAPEALLAAVAAADR